jgi:citrate synthase
VLEGAKSNKHQTKQETAMSGSDNAKLSSLGTDYEFGIHEGTVGPSVIDVSSLYGQTGQFTYDPGFTSTASCKSEITFIDGEKGVLLHRGYRATRRI